MEATNLTRVFKYNNTELPDPGEDMSPHEVLGYYSVKYPELTTATVSAPDIEEAGNRAVYTIKTTIGDKG